MNTQLSTIISADVINNSLASAFDLNALETSGLPTRPCIVRLADAATIEFPGEKAGLKLPSKLTSGRVTVGTLEALANGGPPPHVHRNDEEIFLVTSGAFEVFVNGQTEEIRQGDIAYLASGEAHRFKGISTDEPNKFEIIIAPGGFENFYVRWAALFENGVPSPEDAVRLADEFHINVFMSDTDAPIVADTKSKIVRQGQNQVLSVLGNDVTVLLSAKDTEGKYSLVQVEGNNGSGPPLHCHQVEDELFLIQAGRVAFTLDKETVIAFPGDVVWAPRGYAHTFRMIDDGCRMAVFMTPGGFDGFFSDCAIMEMAGDITHENIVSLSANYGLTYAG